MSIADLEEIKAKEGNLQALILLFLFSFAFRIGLVALSFTINQIGTDEEKRQLTRVQSIIDDTGNSSVGALFEQGIQKFEADIVARTSTSPSTKTTSFLKNEWDLLKKLEYEREKLKEELTLGKEAKRLIDEAVNNDKCPPLLYREVKKMSRGKLIIETVKKSPLNEDEFSFFELKEIYAKFQKVPFNHEYGSFFNTWRERERALRLFRKRNILALEKALGISEKAPPIKDEDPVDLNESDDKKEQN